MTCSRHLKPRINIVLFTELDLLKALKFCLGVTSDTDFSFLLWIAYLQGYASSNAILTLLKL